MVRSVLQGEGRAKIGEQITQHSAALGERGAVKIAPVEVEQIEREKADPVRLVSHGTADRTLE